MKLDLDPPEVTARYLGRKHPYRISHNQRKEVYQTLLAEGHLCELRKEEVMVLNTEVSTRTVCSPRKCEDHPNLKNLIIWLRHMIDSI